MVAEDVAFNRIRKIVLSAARDRALMVDHLCDKVCNETINIRRERGVRGENRLQVCVRPTGSGSCVGISTKLNLILNLRQLLNDCTHTGQNSMVTSRNSSLNRKGYTVQISPV